MTLIPSQMHKFVCCSNFFWITNSGSYQSNMVSINFSTELIFSDKHSKISLFHMTFVKVERCASYVTKLQNVSKLQHFALETSWRGVENRN
jgi:hypothetical protein